MGQRYDVIIVGAGLVGLVLASLLIKNDLRVAIIETGTVKPQILSQETFQLRVSALNFAAKAIFSEIDIWDDIIASGKLSPFERMFVWDSLGREHIEFDCTEIAQPCLGYILENAVIYNALLSELQQQPNLTILCQRQPEALELTSKEIVINLLTTDHQKSREKISAQLLVGADGTHSWVRNQANIDCYNWSYDHQALVTTVEVSASHQKTAWQCFLPKGPLALLPLSKENICSIVWSAPPDEINRLTELTDRDFDLEISKAYEFRLGNISKISPSITFPLQMRHAKSYITERVALIGDAAHTVHPLAGQGINLGFADARALATKIIVAKQKFNDCGHYPSLRSYELKQKSDNWTMILGIEFFKRLFQQTGFIPVQLRTIGLKTANNFQVIKNLFTQRALGK